MKRIIQTPQSVKNVLKALDEQDDRVIKTVMDTTQQRVSFEDYYGMTLVENLEHGAVIHCSGCDHYKEFSYADMVGEFGEKAVVYDGQKYILPFKCSKCGGTDYTVAVLTEVPPPWW